MGLELRVEGQGFGVESPMLEQVSLEAPDDPHARPVKTNWGSSREVEELHSGLGGPAVGYGSYVGAPGTWEIPR